MNAPREPLTPAAVAFGLGFLATTTCRLPALAPWLALTVLLGLRGRAGLRPLLLACLLGGLQGTHARHARAVPSTLALPAVYRIEGRVARAGQGHHGRVVLLLRDARVRDLHGELPLPPIELRVPSWIVDQLTLTPGSSVSAHARLRIQTGRSAPLTAWVGHRDAITNPHGRLAARRWQAAGVARFQARLPPRDAGLAAALLLGDRSELTREDRHLFRSTGQAHLLAISGLHVGLLLGALVWMLRRLGWGRRLVAGMCIVVIAGFVPLVGAPPSAVRAGLGAVTWSFLVLADRYTRALRVWSLVGLLVLLADPGQSAEPGAQMSFAAVLGILLLAGRIRDVLCRSRPAIPGLLAAPRAPLRSMLAVGLAAWLGTAPFVATHIGHLCPLGPVTALPALPLLALLLLSAVACLVVPAACAFVPAAAFEGTAACLRRWLTLASDWGATAWPVRAPDLWWILAYVVAISLASLRASRRSRIGLLLVVLLVATLFVGNPGDGRNASRQYDAAAPMPSFPAITLASAPSIDPVLAGVVLVGLTAFAIVAVRPCRWLTAGGAAAAWTLGVLSFAAFQLAGLAALFAPFLVATLLGKLPGARRAGARDVRQVVSNGLPAALGAAVALLTDFDLVGVAVFLGGLACLGADTCATEVGIRYGGQPVRLLGGGALQVGESGGVTLLGLLASLFGATLAPAAFLLATSDRPSGWLDVLVVMTAAGFAGAFLDSLLGCGLQYRGRHGPTGVLTEKRVLEGVATEHISGIRWLDNDMVNLVSGLMAAAIAAGLYGILA